MAINQVTESNEEHIMSVRNANTTDTTADRNTRAGGRALVRPLLWLLLVISATCNVLTSVSHLVPVSIVFGLITLAFGAALIVHHYRGRRRR